MNPGKSERKLVRVGNYVMTGKVLGKGHFARVEEAVHNVLRAKVAVKIINVSEITDSYIRKNLKREACIMSKILHPNVVCLFEILEAERNYYLVTELGAGGDLCTYVKSQRHGKLDERKSRPLARQLVSAVAHLHDKGVVHRDLKMENILLDHTRERIKLVDFGLSNFYGPGELLETHCGSPEYAAPELYVSGKKYGPEVDVWSLGVVFYGMLVGKLPFQTFYKAGMTQQEKRKHLMEETRIGLTSKHTKALVECSHLFRNLLPKMLNPISRDRISITDLQLHSWIYGSRTVGFPSIDEDWQNSVIAKISKFLQMPFLEVYSQILKSPYGPIGGIYNIEKLKHLINRLATSSTYHVLPRISISNLKANYHQPSQSTRPCTSNSRELNGSVGTGDGLKRRPRTSEMQNVPDDLKATTNFNAEIKGIGAGDYHNKKASSSKMMSFINDRLHRAFGLRKRPELERPNTVPVDFLSNKTLAMVVGEQEQLEDAVEPCLLKLSLNTQISSGHSSNNHSSRTNFIKCMCSQKSQKPKRPYTSPNKTLTTCVPLGPVGTSNQPHSRGLTTSPWNISTCQADDASDHYISIAPSNVDSLCSSKRLNFTTGSSPIHNPNKTAPPGVPRHTAARAALRRELAARSASKTQNLQKY